jgi:hypothetical protein
MFYSKTTKGFYYEDDKMPADVVSISEVEYNRLLEGNQKGQFIEPDEKGYPVLVDRPEPSAAEIQEEKNATARNYLARTDWYVTRFAETGEAIPQEILEKRAEARKAVV